MFTRILITYMLNIFDLIMTLYFVNKFGIGVEGNPFGRFLLERPLLLVITKVVCIGALLLLLYKLKNHPWARIGSWITLGAYTLLSVYHIILFFLIRR